MERRVRRGEDEEGGEVCIGDGEVLRTFVWLLARNLEGGGE